MWTQTHCLIRNTLVSSSNPTETPLEIIGPIGSIRDSMPPCNYNWYCLHQHRSPTNMEGVVWNPVRDQIMSLPTFFQFYGFS